MTTSKKRILLVDDEPTITRLLKTNLEKTGLYEVREENKGQKALAVAREFGPDLILLDVAMPDLDGGQVASQLRADLILRDTRVIFLTGLVEKETVGAGIANIGGSLFIAKPVDLNELIKTLEGIFGK